MRALQLALLTAVIAAFLKTGRLSVPAETGALRTVNNEIDEFAIPPNDEARLIHRLVAKYKGYGLARPVAEVGKTLNVSLLFVINEFLGIEELTGTMKVTATVIAHWQDDLLQWDPNDFNDLKAMPMRTKDVFLPTIVKDGNGGTQASIFMTGSGQNDRDINSMVWVDYSGKIEAKVTGLYMTACKLNLDDFPFDEQTCEFTFKAWRFSDKRITLHQASGQKLSEHFGDSLDVNVNVNPNWVMSSVASEDLTIPGINDNYSAIRYTVIAARRSDYYVWNVLLPSFAMAVLLLATFFMPFGPDRSMFCITLVLTMNIFQQALMSKLPVTSEVIPYVRQTTVQVIMGISITIESAFVWWLAAKDKRMAVPKWLRALIPKLRQKRRGEISREDKKVLSAAMRKMEVDYTSAKGIDEENTLNMPISASRHSLASKRGDPGAIDEPIIQQIVGEDFVVWGEWLEVAQIIDLIMLVSTIGLMIMLPIFFYRYKKAEEPRATAILEEPFLCETMLQKLEMYMA